MSWDNTRYLVENYNKIMDQYFLKMENERIYVEQFNIPERTTKKNYQGFSLDTLFLKIKQYSFYVNHKQFTSYYWNDYYFLETRIVELTPEEYLRYTYQIEGKEFTTIDDILSRPDIITEVVLDYKTKIENDEKLNLPYLEFIENIFDGRHRVLGALAAGLTGIPCMIFI